jgi:hypothetical protein
VRDESDGVAIGRVSADGDASEDAVEGLRGHRDAALQQPTCHTRGDREHAGNPRREGSAPYCLEPPLPRRAPRCTEVHRRDEGTLVHSVALRPRLPRSTRKTTLRARGTLIARRRASHVRAWCTCR